jgi:nitrite reductase/ring-hydroxylating ferredoxin subunit
MTWVSVESEWVLLANVNGSFYALEDVCGHQRMALSKGRLEGHEVECPLHFARFDVRTGTLVTGPMSEDVLTYEVRVEGDTIYVKQEPNDV